MKHVSGGTSDDSISPLPSASVAGRKSPSPFVRRHGRNLQVAEDCGLADLFRAYAFSDIAQIKAFVATSEAFIQDVAYYLGLKAGCPDSIYDFASLTETAARGDSPVPIGATAGEQPQTAAEQPQTGTAESAKLHASDVRDISGNNTVHACSRKKDRGAGRRLRKEQKEAQKAAQDLQDNPPALPSFPGYESTMTFDDWTHLHAKTEYIGIYCSLLGSTTSRAYRHIVSAMVLAQGLPKFLQRCLDGDFTMEHVQYVTRRCGDIHFTNLPTVDDFLENRRADTTIETFKRALSLKLALTQPPKETMEKVTGRRRVDISTGDDGTAFLTLTGPAPELHACYKRLEAFAREVKTCNTGTFGEQLNPGDEFDDDRLISALMFDILSRTRPQLKLRITSNNTGNGEAASTDFPLDGLFVGPGGIPMQDGETLLDYIERVFTEMDDSPTVDGPEREEESPTGAAPASGQAPTPSACTDTGACTDTRTSTCFSNGNTSAPTSTAAARIYESQILEALLGSNAFESATPTADDADRSRISCEILLDMPTNESWLSSQARTFVTVPMLSLLDQYLSEAPGDESANSTPLPASMPDDCPCTCGRCTSALESPGTPTTDHSESPMTSDDAAAVQDLAGILPDGSPIPADMARRVAGYASTWTRLLTDPATGTPVDARATSYAIPNSVRQTLIAQYVTCTFPGCTRRADTTEVDHIDPFNHAEPMRGGLTQFGNLHCLCKLSRYRHNPHSLCRFFARGDNRVGYMTKK